MKICEHCGQPIRPGQAYDEVIPESMSSARPTAYTHKYRCKRPSSQTTSAPR